MASAEDILPHAVTETIDAVVTPSVRDAVLQEALEELGDQPRLADPEALRDFVVGPLRDSLVRALGADLGASLTDELERVVSCLPPSSLLPLEEPRTGRRARRSTSPSPRHAITPRPGTMRARFAPTPPPIAAWPSPDSDSAALSPRSTKASARSTQPSLQEFLPRDARGATEENVLPRGSLDPRREEDRPTIPSPPPGARSPMDSGSPAASPPSSAQLPRGTATALGVVGTSETPDRRLPRVLVATNDGSLARRLGAWLDPRAAVRRVRSPAALVSEIADAGEIACIVVLDCKEPSIRPIALAALADDLPPTAKVIVWGASDDLCAELCLISDCAASWLYTSQDTRARALADQCAALVS